MRRLLLGLSLLVLTLVPSSLAQDAANLPQLIAAVEQNYKDFFAKSFTVDMVSREVNQLISSVVAEQSKHMGIPMTLTLKHFTLTSDGAKITSQAVLELPDESMRGMLEPQANQMLEAAGVNKAIANLSLTAVGQAAAILAEKQSLFTASNETDATVLLTATDPEINYCGLQIKTARVRLDKANHVIAELRFDFVDQSALWLRLGHRGAIDGAGDVNCPTRISLRHNMKINAGGVKLPDPITIEYQNYTFR
ncbi:MAG TPA: hypothetical protein PLE92_05490 [Lentisphaeria bacterium]|nr:hypothetical protein [Lentisphaerota bacterium]OQC15508.1 MAG: hypothetical protein BWX73_01321 [Lentisphaerae bacterium ADurb.Bin082]HPY90806.1 hypothetical protein [Lentisphaeria bacterium]HQC52567.1 hypothetical protein [Lentisphaeria bacterium]